MTRHYSHYGRLVGATILSLGLAAPAMAQAPPQGDPDRASRNKFIGEAFRNGSAAGGPEGTRDAVANIPSSYKQKDVYKNADLGYTGGDKSEYQRYFRTGYWSAYTTAHERVRQRLSPPKYGSSSGNRYAYSNGYSDGFEDGRSAGEANRASNATNTSRYRAADRGYDFRSGSRLSYEQDYRSGFRSGYTDGYQEGRRTRGARRY
jgi:hypothetical protein